MEKDVKNVLIVQTAFIGDLVLATPLIRVVKLGFPEARLSVLVTPATAEVLKGNPRVDQIMIYDKKGREKGIISFLKLVFKIRRQEFDLAVVPHRSLRSALLVYLAGIPTRVGFHNSAGCFLFTKKVVYRKDIHEVERNLDLARYLGLVVSGSIPEVFPGPRDYNFASCLLERYGIGDHDLLVGIGPGSAWPTKCWLPEGFAQVANRLQREAGAQVILFGGQEDRELCYRIGEMMAQKPIITAGEVSLLQSAALMSRCRVLLSNDSAPVHLAVAMKVPVVAIFGPTVPSFGFGPYGDGHAVVQKDLGCRPCGGHGGHICPRGTFECMKGIEVDEVYQAVLNRLRVEGVKRSPSGP